jgi:membrane protein YdbS with pleckstrin-like domain
MEPNTSGDVVLRQRFLIAYILIAAFTAIALLLIGSAEVSGAFRDDMDMGIYVSAGILVLAVTMVLALFLKYLANVLIITSKEVQQTQGLITKTTRSIPYQKIDNIVIRRSMLDLILQTASIELETPASPGPEIVMRFLPSNAIYDIQKMIKCRMEGVFTSDEAEDYELASEDARKYNADMPADEEPAPWRYGARPERRRAPQQPPERRRKEPARPQQQKPQRPPQKAEARRPAKKRK